MGSRSEPNHTWSETSDETINRPSLITVYSQPERLIYKIVTNRLTLSCSLQAYSSCKTGKSSYRLLSFWALYPSLMSLSLRPHAPASLFPLPWLPTTLHLGCALPPSNFLVSLQSSHLPARPPSLSHSLFFLSHPPTLQRSCHFCPIRPLWENNSLWQAEGERFGDQGHVIKGGRGSSGQWGTAGYLSQLHANDSS